MPEFRISPVTQYEARPKSRFLFWLFLSAVALQTMAGGYWFSRIDAEISELKKQIELLQAEEENEENEGYDV
jgi:hypothetical protein